MMADCEQCPVNRLFLCPTLDASVQEGGQRAARAPAWTPPGPDAVVPLLGKQEMRWLFSAWWGL